MELGKITFNQKYVINYRENQMDIYENKKIVTNFLILKYEFDEYITDIQFNPVLSDIILVSYFKGYCKIFQIVENKIHEKIKFEGINDQKIKISQFNDLNVNIIASLSNTESIIIWDIRDIKYINVLKIEKEDIRIINFKWNRLIKDSIEIKTKKYIKLIDIRSGKVLRLLENDDIIKNVLFLDDENIIIEKNKIEKINIKTNSSKSIECKKIKNFNVSFINTNILIIFHIGEIIFIDISKMEAINNSDFTYNRHYKYNFYNSDKDNEILLYYFDENDYDDDDNYYDNLIIKQKSFSFNNRISKINEFTEMDNIKNNFYDKYEKKISKYISLLNFKENIKEKKINSKKYMDIEEISNYFDKIKSIDIFYRKDFVNYIFGSKINIIKDYNDILDKRNFKEIIEYSELFKIDITKRKDNMINQLRKSISDKNNDDKNIDLKISNDKSIFAKKEKIKSFYIQLIKLLILDNSNEKLIEIYLIFLYLYQKDLITITDKLEQFENEVQYYHPCFSKIDYKILFGLEKDGEKDIILKFLEEANRVNKYIPDNKQFIELVMKAKELVKNVPDFNQPIELDNSNLELKWHKIKISILAAFSDIKLIDGEQDGLCRLKKGVKTIMSKELLTNEKIFNNKDKLECTLILIINPCNAFSKDFEFCSNLLLSEKLNNESLLKIKNKSIKDPDNLCLENLSDRFNEYNDNEKYNFEYLVNNYVSNQNEIKLFLKNILKKKVFQEAYQILFGNNNYKLLNERYLKEFIDKRLKFAPIKPFNSAALTDKMSLNTYISTKERVVQNEISKKINIILNTGCYVLIEEHEIFHLLDCLPHYENNCSLSIKTPRKKNFIGEVEGGIYLEYLLFNKVLQQINLEEILYILNEKNYEKSLIDFREGFEKLEKRDLIIEGIFSYYNSYIDLSKIEQYRLKNTFINVRNSTTYFPYSINIKLKNDVIGNKPFFSEESN